MDLFESAKQIGVHHIREWLPGGYEDGGQWVVKNPMRNDTNAGSFKINLTTGACNDYADDFVGHDAISLYGYLNGLSNKDAAKEILTIYDPSYFPSNDDFKKSDTWYQLTKSHRDATPLPEQPREIARWPLEIKVGSSWRAVMYAVRFLQEDGHKIDLPFTLWTDGIKREWKKRALKDVKYPLYGLRTLVENPNSRVLLTEGQKVASILQETLGPSWSCVGWYGGAGNTHLTDWEPIIGREVWYSFDGDAPGRKAIKTLLDEHYVKAHLVYPPPDSVKGWDLADAVAAGMSAEDIESFILTDTHVNELPAVASPLSTPENRPTRLDIAISEDYQEYIFDNLYEKKEGKDGSQKYVMRPDWYFWISENDAAIKNCIKCDYTTGTKSTAYNSSEIFESNLQYRLQNLGVVASHVTPTAVNKLIKAVMRQNDHYNRVADYIDNLILLYPGTTDTVIDEFMNVFVFNVEKRNNETAEAYVLRCIDVERMYRELFHKFFLRMHARIKGTRLDDSGNFLGLIENDIVPILEGPQEIGKTTLCRWVACDDELYIDLGSGLKQGFGTEETTKKIRGRLIAEIGEMKIMKNADAVETIKSFISMKTGTVNIKFVEAQEDLPMTASFIGTSNPDQYLSDDTGNRRFWPVKLKDINKKYIAEHKDLPMRIHAHYQKLALSKSLNEIYEECSASPELRAFMESLRQDALITYSDYEVCLRVIKKWKENNAFGGSLLQADVERLAVEDRYMTRISQRSFTRAIKDCGFVLSREWDTNTGRVSREWKWMPGSANKYTDEVPF